MSIRITADVLARRLPFLVQTAQNRMANHELFWNVPIRVIRLAQIFMSHTPVAALDKPVYCSREKAAGLLEVSTRSISRYVAALEKRGLITRIKQCCRVNGDWECCKFVWTEAGRTLFLRPNEISNDTGIEVTLPLKTFDADILSTRESSASFCPWVASSSITSGEQRETTLAHKTPPSSKEEVLQNKPAGEHAEKKPHIARMPADIVEAASQLDLGRRQVCYLFSLCKKVGQRLQDVFAISIQTMLDKALRGRDAVGWIISLLNSGRDFRWAVMEQGRRQAESDKDAECKARRRTIAEALLCHGLELPTGYVVQEYCENIVYLVDSAGNKVGSQPISHLAALIDTDYPTWAETLLNGGQQLGVAPANPAKKSSENAPVYCVTDIGRTALEGLKKSTGSGKPRGSAFEI